MAAFAKVLVDCGVKLRTFRAVYNCVAAGELSEILNSPIKAAPRNPEIAIISADGRPHLLERDFHGTQSFMMDIHDMKVHTTSRCYFEPLVHLRRRFEDFQIGRDLPEGLTRALMKNVMDHNEKVEKNLEIERAEQPKRGTVRWVNKYLEDREFKNVTLGATILD